MDQNRGQPDATLRCTGIAGSVSSCFVRLVQSLTSLWLVMQFSGSFFANLAVQCVTAIRSPGIGRGRCRSEGRGSCLYHWDDHRGLRGVGVVQELSGAIASGSVEFFPGCGSFVPYATAYRALFQLARTKPGETVLVHGASGGVGVAAIRFGTAAGIKIIGNAGSNEGLKLIKTEGARHTVNHSSPDYQKQVLDLTNGRGVDVIVEMLANVNLGHDLKMLAQAGAW